MRKRTVDFECPVCSWYEARTIDTNDLSPQLCPTTQGGVSCEEPMIEQTMLIRLSLRRLNERR